MMIKRICISKEDLMQADDIPYKEIRKILVDRALRANEMTNLEIMAIRNLMNEFENQANRYREYRKNKTFPEDHCNGAILAYEEAARQVSNVLTAIREHI